MKKLSQISRYFAFIFVAVAVLYSGRVHALGSAAWEQVIGVVLGDENSIRSLGVSAEAALTDAIYIKLTGCPYDSMIDRARTGTSDCRFQNLMVEDSKGGSLLAISTHSLQSIVDSPPPINLAYYFKDLQNDSLLFSSAEAAPVSAPFQAILPIWKAIRNLSYGLLAGFVLVIAIMITMRSKIDPQTVVSAQSAIPRIIISAVLITFSYAIGALFDQGIGQGLNSPLAAAAASFIGGGAITGGAFTLPSVPAECVAAGTGQINSMTSGMNCVMVLIGLVTRNYVSSGLGLFILIQMILFVILLFILFFTFLTRYFKIIALTVFSPMIFAIASIPGQENRIKDWFKDMIAACLAIPAMVFLVLLGLVIHISVMSNASGLTSGTSGAQIAAGWFSETMAIMAGNVLLMAIWITAIKAPAMVENAVKGDKKR